MQLREARRQVHQHLEQLGTTDKLDGPSAIAAFDRSNEHLDAAAAGSCLLLAFTIILLVNQLFKVKVRYSVLARDLAASKNPGHALDEAPEN